jgi:hypothetical protein
MSIAEVRRGKAALAVARDRFTWSPKSGSSSEVAGMSLLSLSYLISYLYVLLSYLSPPLSGPPTITHPK